jgi:hypothetical protein
LSVAVVVLVFVSQQPLRCQCYSSTEVGVVLGYWILIHSFHVFVFTGECKYLQRERERNKKNRFRFLRNTEMEGCGHDGR